MNTKDVYELMFGEGTGHAIKTAGLAEKAEELLARHEAAENRRLAEAEVRDFVHENGFLLAHASKKLAEENVKRLTDSNLPALLASDAYAIMKDASVSLPGDRGLKQASYALYDRWARDPEGHLTVGELYSYRNHFCDLFPKSAAKKVFDHDLQRVGFQTLRNVPFLEKVASEITDQESYERVICAYQLDGDRPELIKARAYIKGLVELSLNDESFDKEARPTLQGITNDMVARVAQELYGDEEDDFSDSDDSENDEVYAPGEEALPHDERTEEMTTIESPVTGENLVLELGVEDSDVDSEEDFEDETDEDSDLFDVDMSGEEGHSSHRPLPDFDSKSASQGSKSASQGSKSAQTHTTITDPTSGQKLDVTLTPHENMSEDMSEDDTFEDANTETEENTKENPETESVMPKESKLRQKSLSKKQVFNICAQLGLTPTSIEENLLEGQELAAGLFAIKVAEHDVIELCRLASANTTVGSKVIRTAKLSNLDSIVSDFMALTAAQFRGMDKVDTAKEKAAERSKSAYLITSDVPNGAPINARRIMSAVWKILPDAEGTLLEDGNISISVKSADRRDINRIAKVLSDVYGVRQFSAQMVDNSQDSDTEENEVSPTTGTQIPQVPQVGQVQNQQTQNLQSQFQNSSTSQDSPYAGPSPNGTTPAGTGAKPMTSPVQKPLTGQQAQADFMQRHLDPMKTAQVEDDDAGKIEDDGDGDMEDDLEDEARENEEGLEGDVDGDEFDGDMGAPAPMQLMPSTPGGAQEDSDAAHTPFDLGSGQLRPEDEDAVRSSMSYFRNTGVMPLEALGKFSSTFKAMLDAYGSENSQQRAMAEAAVIRLMSDAYQKPAVIPTKTSGLKTPAVKKPKVNSIKVDKNFNEDGDLPNVKVSKNPAKSSKGYSDKNMSDGDNDTHSFGTPSAAKKKKQKLSDTGFDSDETGPFESKVKYMSKKK